MINLNYTPLHLPHHFTSAPKKHGISPLWIAAIVIIVALQGVVVYMFFSGRIGGAPQVQVRETTPPASEEASGAAAMTSATESAVTELPPLTDVSEADAELNALEEELSTTPTTEPAPDIELDF